MPSEDFSPVRWLRYPPARIALALALYGLLGLFLGPMALATTAPLFAFAVARPLWVMASGLRNTAHRDAWQPVQGGYYAYRNAAIAVVEDYDHCRWVSLADVRKVLGRSIDAQALAESYPGRVRPMGESGRPHMRDDALIAHLGQQRPLQVLKFRTWVEHTIAIPGQRVRKNLGIRTPGHTDDE